MKKLIVVFAMILLHTIAEAQPWNSATDYSASSNPSGIWSYGRKWTPESSGFDVFQATWGVNGWGFGAPIWAPSIQGGPIMWADNNSNGLPTIRWTCPYDGTFSLNTIFVGNDARGVDVIAYIALNDSIVFAGNVEYNNDSAISSINHLSLHQGDHIDYLIQWNGGGNHGSCCWTEVNATIDSSCNISITSHPASQSLHVGGEAIFSATSSNPSANYQWQTDIGFGFQNLSNAGQYANVNSSALTVSNLSLSNNSQIFRCVVFTDACSDTTDLAVLSITTDLDYSKAWDGFVLYPNPAQEEINVDMPESSLYEIVIYDMMLKKIFEEEFKHSIRLDVRPLASGVYQYAIKNTMGSSIRGKFVKD